LDKLRHIRYKDSEFKGIIDYLYSQNDILEYMMLSENNFGLYYKLVYICTVITDIGSVFICPER